MNHTQLKNSSDGRKTHEMSALGTFYVGQNTLSTHVIKPYYLVSKAALGLYTGFLSNCATGKAKDRGCL